MFLKKILRSEHVRFLLSLRHRIDTVLQQKKPSRNSASIPNINARLEYTALPKLDPDLPQPDLVEDNSYLSGNFLHWIFYRLSAPNCYHLRFLASVTREFSTKFNGRDFGVTLSGIFSVAKVSQSRAKIR